ncbi:MAG: CBS domain-containing protein [Planctomycetes bacterium]|nr:CBS domain-containing protein [Planctomycetota bacterium]
MPTAEDFMTKHVISVKKDTPIYDALELLRKNDITGMPVIEDDMTLAGVITEKDVLGLFYAEGDDQNKTVDFFMTRPAVSFRVDESLVNVCDFMVAHHCRRVPVVSTKGKLVGIISRPDIIDYIIMQRRMQALVNSDTSLIRPATLLTQSKKTQKIKRTFSQYILFAWFKKKKAKMIDAIITKTKTNHTTKDIGTNNTDKMSNTRAMAKIEEKLKAESKARAKVEKRLKTEIKARAKAEKSLKAEIEKRQKIETQVKKIIAETGVETGEKVRSCTVELKNCIELINNDSDSTVGELNGSNNHTDVNNINNRKSNTRLGNYNSAGSVKSSKSSKKKSSTSSKKDISPAEMVTLAAKAEEKICEAVAKAKEEDKKAKRAK